MQHNIITHTAYTYPELLSDGGNYDINFISSLNTRAHSRKYWPLHRDRELNFEDDRRNEVQGPHQVSADSPFNLSVRVSVYLDLYVTQLMFTSSVLSTVRT